MKREEKIANDFFISKGFNKIQYEPDGNIPPDFLLDGVIAAEVRRLNQHAKNLKNPVALEKLDYKLLPRIRNVLKSINSPNIKSSAFLTISYCRPLTVDKKLITDIENILHDHIQVISKEREYKIRENLIIRIWPTKRRLSNIYEIGIQSDHDTGGSIIGEIHRSLKIVIEEKELKVGPYYQKYDKWWLVLIDHIGIGIGLDDQELNLLKTFDIDNHFFGKIIILPPYDFKKVVIFDKVDNN